MKSPEACSYYYSQSVYILTEGLYPALLLLCDFPSDLDGSHDKDISKQQARSQMDSKVNKNLPPVTTSTICYTCSRLSGLIWWKCCRLSCQIIITSCGFHLPSGSSFCCSEEGVKRTQRHQTSANFLHNILLLLKENPWELIKHSLWIK